MNPNNIFLKLFTQSYPDLRLVIINTKLHHLYHVAQHEPRLAFLDFKFNYPVNKHDKWDHSCIRFSNQSKYSRLLSRHTRPEELLRTKLPYGHIIHSFYGISQATSKIIEASHLNKSTFCLFERKTNWPSLS